MRKNMTIKIVACVLISISILLLNIIHLYTFSHLIYQITTITNSKELVCQQIITNLFYVLFFLIIGILSAFMFAYWKRRETSFSERLIISAMLIFVIVITIIKELFGIYSGGSISWIKIGIISLSSFDFYLIMVLLVIPSVLQRIFCMERFMKRFLYTQVCIIASAFPGIVLFESFLIPALFTLLLETTYMILENDKYKFLSIGVIVCGIIGMVLYMDAFVANDFLKYASNRAIPIIGHNSQIIIQNQMKEEIGLLIQSGEMGTSEFSSDMYFLGRAYPMFFMEKILGRHWIYITVGLLIILGLAVTGFIYIFISTSFERKIAYCLLNFMFLAWFLIFLRETGLIGITTGVAPFSFEHSFIWVSVIIFIISLGLTDSPKKWINKIK